MEAQQRDMDAQQKDMDGQQTEPEAAFNHGLHHLKQENARKNLLRALAEGACRTEACYSAHISRQTLYNWMGEDEAFARHVRLAEEEAASLIEGVLFRCAQKAEFDPRYQRSLKLYLDRRERRLEKRQEEHRRKKAEERLAEARLAEERLAEVRLAEARRRKAKERASSPLGKHLQALARIERETAWLREEEPAGAAAPQATHTSHTAHTAHTSHTARTSHTAPAHKASSPAPPARHNPPHR